MTPRRFSALIIIAASVVWMLPLLLTGSWYDTHEYYRYPWLAQEFSKALGAGILYPRWLPDINGGYGYPTFVFYQPGFFYLASFFSFFVSDIVHACWLAVWAIFLCGAVGAYRLCRLWSGRPESLVFTLIFLSTPYVLFNYLTRGDLTELMAMMIAPWQLHCLLRIAARARKNQPYYRRLIVLAGLMAVQCYSHMFVAAPMFGILAVTAFLLWLQAGRDALLGRGVFAALLGGVIAASPHWFVMVQMKPYVSYAAAISDIYVTTSNLKPFATLLEDFMRLPFFMAMLGFWVARNESLMKWLGVLTLLLFALTHSVARTVWEHISVLDYFQFPWRFYGLIAVLQLVGLAQLPKLAARFGRVRFERGLVAALLVHLVIELSCLTLPMTLDFDLVRDRLPWQHETLNNRREFDPVTMKNIGALPDRTRIPVSVAMNSEGGAGVWLGISFEGLPYHINFLVRSGQYNKRGGALPDIIVNQLYFPGWRATVNGTAVRPADETTPMHMPALGVDEYGRILLRIPAEGSYEVSLWYDGPPHWLLRNLVAVLMLCALAVWVRSPRLPLQLVKSVKQGIFQDAS